VDVGGSAVTVATGYDHACAVLDSGAVKCWGRNSIGQLGDGSTNSRPAPGPAVDLGGVRASAVTASFASTCALLDGGAIKCWGDGANGLLGNGDTSNQTAPVSVTGLAGPATAVACGYFHCCALVTVAQGSQVFCWGSNSTGAVGSGNEQGSYTSAIPVANLAPRAIRIAPGEYYTCALLDTGEVLCWGDDTAGMLGIGLGPWRLQPYMAVGLGAAAVAVASGHTLACAILTAGDVWCWGSNVAGGLGIGSADASTRAVPTSPVDLAGHAARAITVGDSHVCVVLDSGELKCWGENTSGQLGLGDTDNRGDGPGELGANLPAVDLGP
jgi:alpha-tubulin suppressor-like RCC1 family protein